MARSGVGGGRAIARSAHFPRWLREFVFVGLIYLCYEASRGLQTGAFHIATRNGRDILRWEQSWDLAPEHLLTTALLGVTPLAVAAAYFYSTMHYLITPIVLVWLYRKHADRYRVARTALAISTIIGLAGFYLLPTAPPRMLKGAGIPDALFDVRDWGWWGGEGSVPRGMGGLTNQFAAMPSLHVGWALWCGFLLFRYSSRRLVRWLGIAYPLLTTLVVLSTGNHYLLDAVAGAIVMALGAGLAILLTRLGERVFASRVARRPADHLDAAVATRTTSRTGRWLVPAAYFGFLSPTALTLTRLRGTASPPPAEQGALPESVMSESSSAMCTNR